jgi:hypothetical protein
MKKIESQIYKMSISGWKTWHLMFPFSPRHKQDYLGLSLSDKIGQAKSFIFHNEEENASEYRYTIFRQMGNY